MEETEEYSDTFNNLSRNSECHSDSSENVLKIDENEETPKRKRKSKQRKEFAKLDRTIEETMKKCENITPESAKKMLLKLVKNEHVLALSLLKAEEEEKRERSDNRKSSDSDGDDNKSENDVPTPKLTRLKAKQLNRNPLPIGPLKQTEPCEEVKALIQQELKSDDEDDEYQPNENDIPSDEDATNTTFSDIDSQPSTPGSALLCNEQDFDSPIKDGEFKIPRTPLTAEEQENIARRTRSKFSLAMTPIETIESTFVPPDITNDMYDFDQDHEIDNEWREFLNEFMLPLTNNEDDDEADPEFVVPGPVPVDKEELRPVRVSKKELNQLISELLEETSDANFNQEQIYDFTGSTAASSNTVTKKNEYSSDGIPAKHYKRIRQASPPTKTKSPKISSKMYSPSELNTPPRYMTPSLDSSGLSNSAVSVLQTPTKKPEPQALDLSAAYYPPLQSPQRIGYITPNPLQSPSFHCASPLNQSTVTPIQSPLGMLIHPTSTPIVSQSAVTDVRNQSISTAVSSNGSFISQSPVILVMNSQNQLELCSIVDTNVAFNSTNLFSQPFCNNGTMHLPQFQPIIVQVPTIDPIQNRINLSAEVSLVPPSQDKENNNIMQLQTNENANLTDDTKKHVQLSQGKLKAFEYLNNYPPPSEFKFDQGLTGFTYEQKAIYDQQMRMHAQLLSQYYVQLYAHPKFWQNAEPVKNNLLELEKIVRPEVSPQTARHIQYCLKFCSDWEKELEENSERNQKYIQFFYEEVEYDESIHGKRSQFKGRFHTRLMEHFLNSKAILYPKMLPKTPLRSVRMHKIDPPNSELSLIAFGIEHCYNELYRELNSFNPRKIREPKVNSIARAIVRAYNSFRNEHKMLRLIESYRNSPHMNPIKYYFIHKKSPGFRHFIEDVDLNNMKAPKQLRRGLLPRIWDTYMFSHERLQLHPYQPAVDDNVELNSKSVIEVTKNYDEVSENLAEEFLSSQSGTTTSLDNSYKIEITYDHIPKINISCIANEPEVKEIKSNNQDEHFPSVKLISSPSPPKSKGKSAEEKKQNLTSILKKVSDKLIKSPLNKKKRVNFLLPETPVRRKSPRFAEKLQRSKLIANSFLLAQKFFIVIESFFAKYIKVLTLGKSPNKLLITVFNWTKTIDIYIKLLKSSMMISKKTKTDICSGSATVADGSNKHKKCISTEEYSKKLNRKLADNRALIMESVRCNSTIEKDCSYAYNYLERVKKTLTDNGDNELFNEFQSMLTSFDPDYESVPELYCKIESLLMPNYAELLDLFLTFLLPEHAAEIGKFFEHFVLTNMTNLLQKLSYYFNKQPSHMKKIYSCLNELSNEPDLTMERLKTKILPLLKGNQILIDWFTQLFERPPDHLSNEYETIYIKKSLSDSENSIDNHEEILSSDLVDCDNDFNSCGVKYINGKIIYRCRTILPAKISFLAHDAPFEETKTNDINKSLCVHEIRNHIKFNDELKDENNVSSVDRRSKSKLEKRKIRPVKRYKLCDSQTLHAHLIRLNPVHAQNGEKLSDVMHLMAPQPGTSSQTGDSPKKHSTRSSVKKGGNSPVNPKKALIKSPSSSPSNSLNSPNVSPSKAIQTAKKLRSIVDDEDYEECEIPEKKPQLHDYAEHIEINKAPLADSDPKSSANNRICDWTRDEDKLILEEIKEGKEKEDVLTNLLPKLNRSKSEINGRYEFLMDILMMMN